MKNFPIACQTITFGEEQRHYFDEILPAVSAAGYDGVEIGFRHIREIPPERLHEMLEAHGIKLAATHVGGNLLDKEGASSEKSELDRVLDYISVIGTKHILYSGLDFHNASQFSTDLDSLQRAADQCRERQIRLLYHNHDFEFADDWRIMRAILRGSTSLELCPDLGWIYRSGVDVMMFLEEAVERIKAVHLKDFTSNNSDARFTELGRGKVPLETSVKWLLANTEGMWVILEQDTTELDPGESIRLNAEYGRKLLANSATGRENLT